MGIGIDKDACFFYTLQSKDPFRIQLANESLGCGVADETHIVRLQCQHIPDIVGIR